MKSPANGIVIIDSPDNWRGRPVKIGEKVLTVSDPKKTELQLWIPETDMIPINRGDKIKVILKSHPSTSYYAKILYINNEPAINKRNMISYSAKAEWVEKPPKEISLGATGSAILYGEKVSLFYYLFRKPWYTIRNMIGV